MRHRIHRVVLFLAFAFTLLGQAPAAPTPLGSRTEPLHRRQADGAPLSQTIVSQTVQTIDTGSGPVTETCTLTFTPVTGANGEPLVEVVRQCTQVPGAGTQPLSTSTTTTSSASSSTPPSTSTTSSSASTSSTSTSTTSSTTSSQSTSTTSTSSTTSSRSTSTTSTSSTTSSRSTSTTSTSSTTSSRSTSTSSTSTSSSSSSTSTSSVVANTGVSVVGLSSVPQPTSTPTPPPSVDTTTSSSSSASNGGSPVTAADNTSTSPSSTAQSAFSIPGRKISVLPIGLGIFAGISVIALIVVGLVTYERTKYRKIFRQRRLAEQGQGMGYS